MTIFRDICKHCDHSRNAHTFFARGSGWELDCDIMNCECSGFLASSRAFKREYILVMNGFYED